MVVTILDYYLYFVNSQNADTEGGDRLFKRIKALCKLNKISIASLEKALGFGNGTIGRWGKGSSPTVENLKRVADFFGVTVDFLIKEDG